MNHASRTLPTASPRQAPQHTAETTPERLKLRQPMAWATSSLAMVLGVLITSPQQAKAQPINNGDGSYTLNFGVNYGPTPPAGNPWWLSALISPLASGNGVTIDLTANLKDPKEFISKVGFNLIDKIQGLSWSCSSSDINCSDSSVVQDFNDPNLSDINFANGIKGLDLAINLPIANKPSGGRMQGSDKAQFTINGTGLKPINFLTVNNPSSPVSGIYSAARVQALAPIAGSTEEGSTTIADPDKAPGPLPLLGAGVALGFSRRLRQRLALEQGLR